MHLEGIVLYSIHASEAVLEACAHRHPAQVIGIYTLLSASHFLTNSFTHHHHVFRYSPSNR